MELKLATGTLGKFLTDGTGKSWEFTDGYACLLFTTTEPTTTFTPAQWSVAKDLVAGADNAAEMPLTWGYSTPGAWTADSCPPPGPECTVAGTCPDPSPANPCLDKICTPRGECRSGDNVAHGLTGGGPSQQRDPMTHWYVRSVSPFTIAASQ